MGAVFFMLFAGPGLAILCGLFGLTFLLCGVLLLILRAVSRKKRQSVLIYIVGVFCVVVGWIVLAVAIFGTAVFGGIWASIFLGSLASLLPR